MKKFSTIPAQSGLFWYYQLNNELPEPVLLNESQYPGAFKGFNGRRQSWLRDGEFLVGPQPVPEQSAIETE